MSQSESTTQVVEYLPRKLGDLSSKPQYTPKVKNGPNRYFVEYNPGNSENTKKYTNLMTSLRAHQI
jgi:hypothetical protein